MSEDESNKETEPLRTTVIKVGRSPEIQRHMDEIEAFKKERDEIKETLMAIAQKEFDERSTNKRER